MIYNYIKTWIKSRTNAWFISKINYILDKLNFWNKISENKDKKYYKIITNYEKNITRLNASSIIIIIKSFLSKIWNCKSWSFKSWYRNINGKKIF